LSLPRLNGKHARSKVKRTIRYVRDETSTYTLELPERICLGMSGSVDIGWSSMKGLAARDENSGPKTNENAIISIF
jgi:hypothetical protein